MSIVVEHEKRRAGILEKALDVFMDEGFEDATFQKIADRCGITRTILYHYFKNKKDIFNYSIKQMLLSVEEDIVRVEKTRGSRTEKLVRVMNVILDQLAGNRRLLEVILNYLSYIARSGADPDLRVRRRTVRLRHILSAMIIAGIREGEFAKISVKDAVELLYSCIESAAVRLVSLGRRDTDDLKAAVRLAIERFKK